MQLSDIPHLRLASQKISHTAFTKPEEVVSWMGAMQAQDYLMSLWGVGLRTKGCTQKDVEQAIADRKIVRTWPMRRTLHFVSARDVHWMVRLSSEKIIRTYSAHMPQLGLNEEIIAKSRNVIVKILSGGKCLTRDEIYRHFTEQKIPVDQSRGIHILWRLGQEALVCFGPRQGKQQTFTLLDEWIPKKRLLPRDEAIAEIVIRYMQSHGPATVQDIAWWSGLTITDIKSGIASVASKLATETIDKTTYYMAPSVAYTKKDDVYLLPSFDEYFISYKDRTALIDADRISEVNRGLNGMFKPIIVVNGRIEGTWKRDIGRTDAHIDLHAFTKFSDEDLMRINAAVAKFGTFLTMNAQL